jgi:hypothetical protein
VFVDVQTTLEIFEQNPISSQNGKHFYFSCESVLNCNGMPISFVLPWKGGDGFAEFAGCIFFEHEFTCKDPLHHAVQPFLTVQPLRCWSQD